MQFFKEHARHVPGRVVPGRERTYHVALVLEPAVNGACGCDVAPLGESGDRRATLVFPTDRGWQQIRAALSIIATLEEEWTRRLGARRMQQLRELPTELGAITEQ